LYNLDSKFCCIGAAVIGGHHQGRKINPRIGIGVLLDIGIIPAGRGIVSKIPQKPFNMATVI